ncbi:hypothetical protein GCM10009798_18580 [Nocardioides panacihumi]|uniref:HTH merR-type domain-containing protein n=2 Tax=Nocardioides panacihumi TaxID=400774 RepID=A0ABN2QWG7_9ACTN
MLSVGEVARRTGLTTKALRHYDRLGLLVPAAVSDDGYRWYDEVQLRTARLIARLRALEMPLDAVRAVLAGDDARPILERHRIVLQARSDRVHGALHALDHLMHDERGVTMATDDATPTLPTDQRALAVQLFNDTWTLLEKEGRTPEDDLLMIHTAHASRLHWEGVGDDQHRAIGEWQVARVYSTLGRAEPALFHSERALELAARPGVDDWLLASTHEGLARALAVAGDLETARDVRDRALTLLEGISDPEDRKIVADDIDTLPIP